MIMVNIGVGLKYYFIENFFVKVSFDGQYGLEKCDNGYQGEWMVGLGVGFNFGGLKVVLVLELVVDVCFDFDNDGVCDNVDKCLDILVNVIVDVNGCLVVVEVVCVQLDVKFDFDKFKVKENSYVDIKNLVDFMKQYLFIFIIVEGYIDFVGIDVYNQKLFECCVNVVCDVLVNEYGVEGGCVNVVGYGEFCLVVDNVIVEGCVINCCVEVEVEVEVK